MSRKTPNTESEGAPWPDKQPGSDPDVEAGQPPATPMPTVDVNSDSSLVTWSGPDDADHPKNWSKYQKWTNTWAVSLFVFISPVSSAMIAPALQQLGTSLEMHTKFEIYLSMAIFVLAYAVGPILFGPLSELYGRVRLLQASNVWYLAWNLGCGFATNKAQFFAFRFLAGIGASAPLAIGGGAIA